MCVILTFPKKITSICEGSSLFIRAAFPGRSRNFYMGLSIFFLNLNVILLGGYFGFFLLN